MSKYNLKLGDAEHPYKSLQQIKRDVEDEDWEREQRRREYEDENNVDAEQPVDSGTKASDPTDSPL